jgi:hypothetical protein
LHFFVFLLGLGVNFDQSDQGRFIKKPRKWSKRPETKGKVVRNGRFRKSNFSSRGLEVVLRPTFRGVNFTHFLAQNAAQKLRPEMA